MPVVPALRLVEMPVALTGRTDHSTMRNASPASSMADHETRRCAVCGAHHPVFGFGPPLSQKGTTIWACGAHRHEVDHQLTATGHFDPTRVAHAASDDAAARGSSSRKPAPPEATSKTCTALRGARDSRQESLL